MPWTVALNLDTAVDGDSVGEVIGTYADDTLFVEPFQCSARVPIKPPFSEIIKAFAEKLTIETNRRAVASKMSLTIQEALNSQ